MAEIVAWWKQVIENDRLDFINFEPKHITTTAELVAYFDNLLADAKQALWQVADTELDNDWSMTNGEDTYFTLPKKTSITAFLYEPFGTSSVATWGLFEIVRHASSCNLWAFSR